MPQPEIRGMWKLIDVTNSPLSGRAPNSVLHFVDDKHYYQWNQGEIHRLRYQARPEKDPAELDFKTHLAIYRFVNGKLEICRAMPEKSRPKNFSKLSVEIYEYMGEGPPDWKTKYKREIRKRLERTAEKWQQQPKEFDENEG